MKALIAEDEQELARAEQTILAISHIEADIAHDGQEAVDMAATGDYDVIVLDVMMPRMDGIEALKRIRAAGDTTPIIMLTAKAEVDDRITGLDAGADDYLTKPFAMKELLARIRSQARRSTSYTPSVLDYGSLRLNIGDQQISCENTMHLSGRETKLLACLMLNPDKPISTERLLAKVWDDEPDADQGLVYVYVSYLRDKLRSIACDVTIDGERGGSYRLTLAGNDAPGTDAAPESGRP
ncbi:response regulator transcription factor [Bifidobacterium thermophilum]|uniref:response regulator transcription factor n=1 Tax=Bifidobacterium thermophilum TaxID=33905 RepID=UPI00309D901D